MTDELNDEPTIQEPTDNLPETEGLLRDIDAPVVIELGRLKMNTAQVTRLKSGQILRLPRNANDPVDLVVNDKLFARGELVEIDGELGVRLVQVTGASQGYCSEYAKTNSYGCQFAAGPGDRPGRTDSRGTTNSREGESRSTREYAGEERAGDRYPRRNAPTHKLG